MLAIRATPIDRNLVETGSALNQSPSINNNRQRGPICPPLPALLLSRLSRLCPVGEYPPARDRVSAKRRARAAPRLRNGRSSIIIRVEIIAGAPFAGPRARTPSGGLRLNTTYAFDTFATTRKAHLHLERGVIR